MTTIEIPSPSQTGRIGVAGGSAEWSILSAIVVSDDGVCGKFEQVRMQGRNSRGNFTKGAYFRIPAAEAVELAVALINVAVESKPSLKGEVFSALMRIAANADPDVQHVDKE